MSDERKSKIDTVFAITLLAVSIFMLGAIVGDFFAHYRIDVSVKAVEKQGGSREQAE